MADLDILTEKYNKMEVDNYICVQFGLKFTVDGLQDIVVTSLKKKLKDIQRKCTHAPCTTNCSRKLGSSFNRWCNTCIYWKDELRSLHRKTGHWNRIVWNKLDTQDIQRNHTEMVKVFIKDFHAVRQCVLKDLNALMSLFKNMSIFHFSEQILDDVRINRNNFIAHNYSLTLKNVEKRICLTSFIQLIETAEIKCTQSGKQALNSLQNLQSCSHLPDHLFLNNQTTQTLEIIRIEHNELATREPSHSFLAFNQRVKEIQNIFDMRRKYFNYLGPNPKHAKHLYYMFIAVVLCLLYGYDSIQRRQHIEPEGCLDMHFDEQWGLGFLTDFQFHADTLNEETVIDRKWLAELVKTEMENNTKGILLTADMGYGKSTIVSNIVCAEKSSGWYNLRESVLLYHFCRYNSRISTDVALLIQNIAGAIVQRFPELGNAILSDKIANEILYGSKCSDDPINCMEIGILRPLRKKWKKYDFIIIIDSLDECDIENKNNILDFLYYILDKLPPNIRFILTSRNVEKIIHRFKQLSLIKLENFLLENEHDIKLYIRRESEITDQQVKLLINITHGNFLHVKLYLKYCKESETCDFTKIPESIEKLYQLNFERIFKDETGLFQEIRPVLEVLCTMTNPLPENEILNIANVTSELKRRTCERLIGDKLGHFLRFSDGNISLLHKSIADFLTDTSRKHQDFFIYRENGHGLFAAYLLNSLNITRIMGFVELVHHVALSGKEEYKAKLFELNQHIKQVDNVTLVAYLHHTVKDFNSYETTSLMLQMISKKYINAVDDQGHTALFIAAAYGNEAALENLLDEGASSKFKVEFRFYHLYFGEELVRACKYVYFCGYNILHISSQNGHLKIVKLLLNALKELAYEKNDMNLNAFEVAVENGHTDIAEEFLRHEKQFASERSLYYASKNGYLKLANILIRHGIKDKCLPCNGTLYWIPPNSYRRQQEYLIGEQSSSTKTKHAWPMKTDYKFYDDWHLINCETALNVAVRHNHLEIVKALLKEAANALNCRTFDGKTVLMTAIQYNATDVFSYFLQIGYFLNELLVFCNDTKYFSYEDRLRLSKSENEMLDTEECPNGASITHMLAITDNFEFMIELYTHGFESKKYDIEDSQSLTPLHYAFCRDSISFITAGKAWNFNFKAKSKNGSTPFHSGAIRNGLSLYSYTFSRSANFTIPDVFDNEGRSILQYYFLSHIERETAQFDSALHFILLPLIYSMHNLYHRDDMGRNFLHYAAQTGNAYAFNYAIHTKTVNSKKLLSQKDNSNITPFEQLFRSMQNRNSFEAIKIPTDCHFKDIFLESCNVLRDKILSPHEYCIFIVAMFFKENQKCSALDIISLLRISIDKLRIYPIIVLKVYAQNEFTNAVDKSTELLELISNIPFPSPTFAEFILTKTTALNCEGGLSPLHKIISNKRNRHWQYANEAFFTSFLSPVSSYKLDWCYDKEGYNLLHRAIMGGNIVAVRYLLNKGMDINRSSRNGENSLFISVNNAPYFQDGKLPMYYSKTQQYYMLEYTVDNQSTIINHTDFGIVDFDMTATLVLNHTLQSKQTSLWKLKDQLCAQGEERLGLVHISAAKGLLMFQKRCKSYFGGDILKCLDINNISAKYLAKMYGQTHVILWMNSLKVGMPLPNNDIKSLLLYNSISNYRVMREHDWICTLRYSHRFKGLLYYKAKRCFKRENNFDNIFIKHSSYLVSNNFHRTLTILNTFHVDIKNERALFLPYCSFNFIGVCSTFVKLINTIESFMSRISSSIIEMMKKNIVFGVVDTRVLFHSLIAKTYDLSHLIQSIFGKKYRYLSILRHDDELHSFWIKSQYGNFTKISKTDDAFYLQSEFEITMQIMKKRLVNQYELIEIKELLERHKLNHFSRLIILLDEYVNNMKSVNNDELYEELYSYCRMYIHNIPISIQVIEIIEMLDAIPNDMNNHFPTMRKMLVKIGKFMTELSMYKSKRTVNGESTRCAKVFHAIAKLRWPR